MPVTDLLSSVRPSTAAFRRSTSGRALALTAALGVSLTLVNAAAPDSTRTVAAAESVGTPRVLVDDPEKMVAFTAFTPREAQMPQIVPESVPEPAHEHTAWEEHRPAVEIVPAHVIEEQRRVAAEAARPKTVRPVAGRLTSNFGSRWGTMHAGIDFGDPIGAPIVSVTDGVVLEAGPASGFGLWVRIQQDDGSTGVYGHMNEILVGVGQHVRAGDLIATVGNRGYSTGPHLHYEVHMPGVGPIDPSGWLGARGIHVGQPVG